MQTAFQLQLSLNPEEIQLRKVDGVLTLYTTDFRPHFGLSKGHNDIVMPYWKRSSDLTLSKSELHYFYN
jgi:hypothetical protein